MSATPRLDILAAPAGMEYRVRLYRGALSDVPSDEVLTVRLEPDAYPGCRSHGRRSISREGRDGRRLTGWWDWLDSGAGSIAFGGVWFVGVAEVSS